MDNGRGGYLSTVVDGFQRGANSSRLDSDSGPLEGLGGNSEETVNKIEVSTGASASTLGPLAQTDIDDVVVQVFTTDQHWDAYAEQYGDGVLAHRNETASDVEQIEDSLEEQIPAEQVVRPTQGARLRELRRLCEPISDLHNVEARAILARPVRDREQTERAIVSPSKPPVQRRKGGRPPGSKNKRKGSNVGMGGAGQDGSGVVYRGRGGRGRAFRPDEALCIAKAWVRQSSFGCNQREDSMWGGIADICVSKFGLDRTKDAIRCKWNVLSRECQHWISARALVATKLPSGRTLEEAGDQVMRVYCRKAGRKDSSGYFREAAPFAFQDTAAYLAQQPKWRQEMEGNGKAVDHSQTTGGGLPAEAQPSASGSGGTGAMVVISDDGTSASDVGSGSGDGRPAGRGAGIKATKAAVKRNAESAAVSTKLDGLVVEMAKVRKTVTDFSVSQVEQAAREEEMMMLQFLPADSAHRQVILDRMVERLQSRVNSDGSKHVGQPAGGQEQASSDGEADG